VTCHRFLRPTDLSARQGRADNGVVFSAGGGSDAAGLHAYVRRSLDGGGNWSHVFQLPTTGLAYWVTVSQKSGLVFATAGTSDTKKAGWGPG